MRLQHFSPHRAAFARQGQAGHRPPLERLTVTGAADSFLWMWTMKAMANIGVARLTTGIDTNTATNIPARKI
jgi:hypothetical protein